MNIGSNARRGGDVQIPNQEEPDPNAIQKASTSPSSRETTASVSLFNNARDCSIERVYHIQTPNVTFNNVIVVSDLPIHGGECDESDSRYRCLMIQCIISRKYR